MKNYLVLFVLCVFCASACNEEAADDYAGDAQAQTSSDEESGEQCETNADCLQFGMKFCVSGTCLGAADPDAVYRGSDESSEPVADVVSADDSTEAVETNAPAEEAEASECEADVDCDDSNICTSDFCANSRCFHKQASDGIVCGTGSFCIAGDCVNCDDSNQCTSDSIYANGVCAHAQIPGCCQSDADCDVGGGCGCNVNYWECSGTTGDCVSNKCETTSSKKYCQFGCGESGCNECAADSDCGMGGGCDCNGNYWECSGTTGNCVDGKCEATFNEEYCQFGCGESGCVHQPECQTDWDCKDFNACTDDVCSVDGECSNPVIPGAIGVPCGESHVCQADGQCQQVQCIANAQCDDGDSCTVDSCSSNHCYYTAKFCEFGCVNGACNPAPECIDDSDCMDEDSSCACQGNYLVCVSNSGQCVAGECNKDQENVYCVFGCSAGECSPPDCGSNEECDDGSLCTIDSCVAGACQYNEITNCVACDGDSDCDLDSQCFAGNNVLLAYTGKCLAGTCEKQETLCNLGCVPWSDESQYCAECVSDSDCSFGQYCTDNKLCGWTGDLQCKFHCPAGKQFAVVWYGDNVEQLVECDSEVWDFPQPLFCSWGECHPVFKFNLWDGGADGGQGNLAQLECNAGPDELILTHLGQGLMKVTLKNVYCITDNCPQ